MQETGKFHVKVSLIPNRLQIKYSFEKFPADKLPDKCNFFSSLRSKCISEKDYLKAITVWNVFKMNTMTDYHDFF